jgi:hypothetical protein
MVPTTIFVGTIFSLDPLILLPFIPLTQPYSGGAQTLLHQKKPARDLAGRPNL